MGQLVLPATLCALAACSPKPAAAPAGAAPRPPEVGVITVSPASVGLLSELPGRTEASRIAQVRARVAGIVLRRTFREGSNVRAGQALYQIDAAPYRATLASAQAQVARAEANLVQVQAQAARSKPLFEAKAISQQEFVNANAGLKLAEADLAVTKAAVQTATINVGYAAVTAPISGRIGRSLVTEGALVGQGEATPLAVVQQIDPMYVNITQPVADVLKLRAAIAGGRLTGASGTQAAAVRLVLDDGSVYPLPGRLLFSDLSVDPGTGQISLRAEVPNPKGDLLPGMYVRAQLEQAAAPGAILLPQQAVQRSEQGDSVKVVGADGKVSNRPVRIGAASGARWVVLEGLTAGEQVMVDGFQKLRGPGAVKAVPWTPPTEPGTTPAAASASAAKT
jgi:membrane fusion protein, multidrug efflux system